MYQSTFGFQLRPFSATARHDWFFESSNAGQSYDTLASCIERAAGSALLIGGPGTGKSLICRLLAERMSANFNVVLLDSARLCTRRAFLQSILFELDLPFRDLEEGELRLTLIDFLKPSEKCPNGMLLLVDEAHVLPMRLFEELHMITNLVRDGQPRVRLVMAGNQSLDETFTSPQLASFNQRIAARCYLKALNGTETAEYIGYQLEKAGGPDARNVFADDTIRTVYEMTEGLPRLINQVCDQALLLASASGRTSVEPATVAEAWADIQQLPTPWFVGGGNANSNGSANNTVIEFGELDGVESQGAESQGAESSDSESPGSESGNSDWVDTEVAGGDFDSDAENEDIVSSETSVESPELAADDTPPTASVTEPVTEPVTEHVIEFGSLEDGDFDTPTEPVNPTMDLNVDQAAADVWYSHEPKSSLEKTAAALNAVAAETISTQSESDVMDERNSLEDTEQSSDKTSDKTSGQVTGELQPEFGFENPRNPFTERFAEEQPVEDQYADQNKAPDTASAQRVRPISLQIDSAPSVAVKVNSQPQRPAIMINGERLPNGEQLQSATASTTSQAEVAAESNAAGKLPAIKLTPPPVASEDHCDDRDIMVMQDESPAVIGSPFQTAAAVGEGSKPKAHREEYQTLFNKLKNG